MRYIHQINTAGEGYTIVDHTANGYVGELEDHPCMTTGNFKIIEGEIPAVYQLLIFKEDEQQP